jgi:tetratricopeptide (TPR) repeat protein
MNQPSPMRPEDHNPRPLWNFSDPEASAKAFSDQAAVEKNPVVLAILKTQIARANGLLGRFDEGQKLISEVLDSAEATNHAVSAWASIERGRLLRSSGADPEIARKDFEQAAARAAEANLGGLEIDALHMIALTLEPKQAVIVTLGAIAKAKASTDELARNWVASLLNNLGMAYTDLGDWDSARTAFEAALEERLKSGNQETIFIAKYMIGWAMRNQGQTAQALAWMTELKSEIVAAGKSDEYVDAELKLLQQTFK